MIILFIYKNIYLYIVYVTIYSYINIVISFTYEFLKEETQKDHQIVKGQEETQKDHQIVKGQKANKLLILLIVSKPNNLQNSST